MGSTGSDETFVRFGALSGLGRGHLGRASVKRLIDVTLALALLLVLLPGLARCGVLVSVSSKDPFCTSTALGRGGQLFWFYKFRTMTDGNDPSDHRETARALIRGEAQPVRAPSSWPTTSG